MRLNNPFIVGIPVVSDKFLGRLPELKSVKNKILNQGQSVALIGESRMGKTSILKNLSDQKNRRNLFGKRSEHLLIQFLDTQSFPETLSQSNFWEMVFEPVVSNVIASKGYPVIEQVYGICKESGFTTFNIERLLAQLELTEWQIVLLLDEFDTLLYHPILNKSEFYGALRSLASRYGKALTIVLASRQSLTCLNQQTQQFSRTGSPYFNFIYEITLGALDEISARDLIALADSRFAHHEIEYILEVAGRFPYFLQTAGSALWDAYEEEKPKSERLDWMSGQLFNSAERTLNDVWGVWSPETKKAFTIVALDELPRLVGSKEFDINVLIAALENYAPELRQLERRGFICKDLDLRGGWSVNGKVMLWWLADELIKALREKDDLGNWLRVQQWDGMLKVGERDQIVFAAKELAGTLKNSVDVLIKAAVEKASKAL